VSASGQKRIRVVVAKPGLDGHDRGAKIIARALRDAGMAVIYTGLRQTPEQIVATVIHDPAGRRRRRSLDPVGRACRLHLRRRRSGGLGGPPPHGLLVPSR
jgi:hypothetical protein